MFLHPNRAIVGALALMGCASTTQRTYVAPSSQTIISETEQGLGPTPQHVIYIRNLSTVPVTVFGTSLSGCENVKQQCTPNRANLRLGPGQRVVAIRIDAERPTQPFRYHFGFSWRGDSSSAASLAAVDAALPVTSRREMTRDQFVANATKVASLRVDPDSIVLAPGETFDISRFRMILADSAGRELGYTRQIRYSINPGLALHITPPLIVTARRPGRATISVELADQSSALVSNRFEAILVPVVVAVRVEADAPLFAGIVLDSATRLPLECLSIGLEDSAQVVVASGRTAAGGTFRLQAPRVGAYRVRFDTKGWSPVFSPMERAVANEQKEGKYFVQFTEQLLVRMLPPGIAEFEHAHPAAVTAVPISGRTGTTPIVSGVTLGGSAAVPILGIIGRASPATLWAQFVVDSTGRVDTASIRLPPPTEPAARTALAAVLPRVRFSPAKLNGKPTCESVRMQVNYTRR